MNDYCFVAALHPYHAAVFQRFYLLCAGLKDTTMPAADFMSGEGAVRLSIYESIVIPVLAAGKYPQLGTPELDLVLEQVKHKLFDLHDDELTKRAHSSSSASPVRGHFQSRAAGQFFAKLHREKVTGRAQPSPLTRHEPKQPPLWSVGKAFLPALLSPRRQEWDDKGKALGVDLAIRIVTEGIAQ